MGKKTNYFSHDSNARNDEKMLGIRIKFGAEGYGIYFMLLERLREECNYSCVKDYNIIAFDLRVDTSKVKSIIEDFGLFVFTDCGKYFYSKSFKERMGIKDLKSIKAKESAEKRWNNANDENLDALPMRTHQKTDASKVKESKVKEVEEEESEFSTTNFLALKKQRITELFKNVSSLDELTISQEVAKFMNKYPHIEPNKAGGLINTWAGNIQQYSSGITQKKMVI